MKESWAAAINSLMNGWGSTLADSTDPHKALANLKIWVGASKTDVKIVEITRVLREVFQDHGAIVLPQSTIPTAFDERLVQSQLQSVDLIAMLAVTPGVSAEALEVCKANKATADK